jgi:8-oxo-dGTP diphosphatase
MNPESPSLFSEEEFDSQVLPDTILTDKVINWLTDLYDLTDWRCVIIDGEIDHEYDGISIVNYFKALALPYLVNISPSERALGRIMLQRNNLQKLCGFRVGYPTKKEDNNDEINKSALGKRTFWHFRNKYKEMYSELMVKVLISLVLSGKNPNFGLPFVERIEEHEFSSNGNLLGWHIDEYKPMVMISLPWTETDLSTQKDRERFDEWREQWKAKFRLCKDLDEYRDLVNEYEDEYKGYARRTKKGFTEEITFPIDVSTSLISGEKLFFRLKNPDWLNQKLSLTGMVSHTNEGTKAPSQKRKYDKACNILLIREIDGEKEILLSRRREVGIGEGSFAAPGGKQREGERLEECAIRELREETGLVLKKSRPVSLYYTLKEFMGGKQIMSVGVLAESWDGKIETKEPDKHVGWEWHKLNDLPSPLFEFTKIAISQFVEDKFPNLSWEDVEEKPDTQLPMFETYR